MEFTIPWDGEEDGCGAFASAVYAIAENHWSWLSPSIAGSVIEQFYESIVDARLFAKEIHGENVVMELREALEERLTQFQKSRG